MSDDAINQVEHPKDRTGKDSVPAGTMNLDVLEAPTLRPGSSAATQDPGPVDADESTHQTAFRDETVLGDFRLLEEIGRGGMGVVYRAHQLSLDRTVAIKVLVAGQWASAEDIQRLGEEAAAAARLNHPAIVPVYEVGQHEGRPFLCMAFVPGQTLAERIRSGPLPAQEAARLLQIIADAVHYAHGCGVIHRDLKPGNILIDEAGRPHVTDFGLAKRLEIDRQLTDNGQVLGTPGYIPPEQAAGRLALIDGRSDVYALGAVLYALVTGRPPFNAANSLDTLLQVLEREPVPPRQLNSAVPRDIETIALKCLNKDPRLRYVTAAALADDLRRYLSDEPIRAKPLRGLPWLARWGRKNLLVASVSGVLAILITAVAAFAAVAYYREVGRRLELEDELARLEQAAEISNKDLGKERSVRIAAQQQTIEEHARRLVADSRLVRQQSHSLSLLLAAEAIESLRRNGLPVADWAVRNLRETIHAVRSSDANNDSQPDLGRLLEAAAQLAGRTMTPAERQQYAIQGG